MASPYQRLFNTINKYSVNFQSVQNPCQPKHDCECHYQTCFPQNISYFTEEQVRKLIIRNDCKMQELMKQLEIKHQKMGSAQNELFHCQTQNSNLVKIISELEIKLKESQNKLVKISHQFILRQKDLQHQKQLIDKELNFRKEQITELKQDFKYKNKDQHQYLNCQKFKFQELLIQNEQKWKNILEEQKYISQKIKQQYQQKLYKMKLHMEQLFNSNNDPLVKQWKQKFNNLQIQFNQVNTQKYYLNQKIDKTNYQLNKRMNQLQILHQRYTTLQKEIVAVRKQKESQIYVLRNLYHTENEKLKRELEQNRLQKEYFSSTLGKYNQQYQFLMKQISEQKKKNDDFINQIRQQEIEINCRLENINKSKQENQKILKYEIGQKNLTIHFLQDKRRVLQNDIFLMSQKLKQLGIQFEQYKKQIANKKPQISYLIVQKQKQSNLEHQNKLKQTQNQLTFAQSKLKNRDQELKDLKEKHQLQTKQLKIQNDKFRQLTKTLNQKICQKEKEISKLESILTKIKQESNKQIYQHNIKQIKQFYQNQLKNTKQILQTLEQKIISYQQFISKLKQNQGQLMIKYQIMKQNNIKFKSKNNQLLQQLKISQSFKKKSDVVPQTFKSWVLLSQIHLSLSSLINLDPIPQQLNEDVLIQIISKAIRNVYSLHNQRQIKMINELKQIDTSLRNKNEQIEKLKGMIQEYRELKQRKKEKQIDKQEKEKIIKVKGSCKVFKQIDDDFRQTSKYDLMKIQFPEQQIQQK